jgi:hypothetical protein
MIQHVRDGGSVTQHVHDPPISLDCHVVQLDVLIGRVRANRVRAVDLARVSPPLGADLGDEDVAPLDDP